MEIVNKYNFIVADDHRIVRHGISLILKELYYDSNVFEASCFSEILQILDDEKIDMIILDVNFPEGITLSMLPEIKKRQPNAKILIFTAFDEDIYAIKYINSGVNGFLNKLSDFDQIKHAISSTIKIGRYFSQSISDKIINSYLSKSNENPFEQLSNREIEIAKLYVDGYGNVEISAELNIKSTTVSTYKKRIYGKLGIKNLSQLYQLFNIYAKGNSP